MTFLVSLLTGLGVGSAGIYIVWLVKVKDFAQSEAQGINLVLFFLASFIASCINFDRGKINFLSLVPFLLSGIVFAIPASIVAGRINSEILTRIFGVFLMLLGTLGFFKKAK